MLEIEAIGLCWLEGLAPEQDLCAHGGVRIHHGGRVLVDSSEGHWTLSAAGLYLLRTLERDHTCGSPVGDQLFPCCGHVMFEGDDGNVVLMGCANGLDGEVRHQAGAVTLEIEGARAVTSEEEWRVAVTRFCSAIEEFYGHSAEKQPADAADAAGYRCFWREWHRRKGAT